MKKPVVASLIVFSIVAIVIVAIVSAPKQRTPDPAPPAAMHGNNPTAGTPSKDNVDQMFVKHTEELKRAVEKNPGNTSHLRMLATLLMDGHKAAEAIPYFERAIRLDPKNDSLLLDLSVCYAETKKYDAAMQTTDRVLGHNAKNLTALYNKGALYATLGKTRDAARIWKQLRSLAPESKEAHQAQSGLTAIGQ
ncbi:MAG TPA: tetratricopeptide repeat protein [Bacteroidota bacterium]|nr:tetratricopeptide repeat protein [Bacteroidota bacterium]